MPNCCQMLVTLIAMCSSALISFGNKTESPDTIKPVLLNTVQPDSLTRKWDMTFEDTLVYEDYDDLRGGELHSQSGNEWLVCGQVSVDEPFREEMETDVTAYTSDGLTSTSSLQVYPNPVKRGGTLNLNNISGENTELRDSRGVIIARCTSGGNYRVDVVPGIYFLQWGHMPAVRLLVTD